MISPGLVGLTLIVTVAVASGESSPRLHMTTVVFPAGPVRQLP